MSPTFNMKKQTKNYWLFLEPYAVLRIKKYEALIYNSLSGEKLVFNNDSLAFQLLKKLDGNNYVVGISESQLRNKDFQSFLELIKKFFLGDIVSKKLSDNKPFQFSPEYNIQNNRKRLRMNKDLLNYNIIQYLRGVSVYLNTSLEVDSEIYLDAYKQFTCLRDEDKKGDLSFEILVKLISGIEHSSIGYLNILGGNIFNYYRFDEAIAMLNNIPHQKNYYIHYNFIENLKNHPCLISEQNNFIVQIEDIKAVNFPELTCFQEKNKNIHYQFIIQDKDELSVLIDQNEKHNLKNNIIPYYNGKNVSFFSKNVFLDKKDILEIQETSFDMYLKSVLNPFDFGKLYVLNDGSVYGNLHDKSVGNLTDAEILGLIEKEFLNGSSWFKTRSRVKPCRNCIFDTLCPPISNYEYTFKSYNLCYKQKSTYVN